MENPEENFSPFDLANGAAEKLSPPPDFDGPKRNRRITDPLCFLVIFCVWGVATWLGAWSLQKGNFNTFVHPADYKGRICGFDKDSNGDELPPLLHVADHCSNGVCVDECPTESNLEPTSRSELICKEEEDLLTMNACLSGGGISDDPDVLVTCGGCMYAMGTREMKFECLPESVSEVIAKVNAAAEGQGADPYTDWERFKLQPYVTRFMKDLHTSFYVVLGSFGGSALLGLSFLLFFCIPKLIPYTVWASAVLVTATFGGGGAFLWFLSAAYDDDLSGVHSEIKVLAIKVLAIVSWIIAGMFLVSVIILREKINLTISLTKAGTRAIREVKLCVLFPLLQVIFYTIFVGIMTLFMVHFSTTGEFVEETENVYGNDVTYTIQKFTAFAHYKFWYLIFVLIWTSAFCISFGRLVLTLCFAEWYFTPEKDEGNSVSVFRCFLTTLLKHTGTTAFASLAMGPIVAIRSPFLLMQKCIRMSGMDNVCVDAFICSCQCCFFIMERFLKFTSKNFYVQTAVFGYSYCKASHESYYLVKRNGRNVSDAGPVGFLCTFFTRIFLCSLTCIIAYYALDSFYGDELFSIVSVTAMIGLLSWFTIGFFMETVAMSVTTLFQCFLADEEMLGNQGSLYVPNEIDEFLARLDESRKAQISVPKMVQEDDQYTVESGMHGGSMPTNPSNPTMS